MMGIPALTQPKVLIKPSANGYDSTDPEGVKGQSGGSLGTLFWSAPRGIEDGNSLIVKSDAHTFQAPEKLNYIGFGSGWLYENEEGALFETTSVSTISGTETFVCENSPPSNRKVFTDGSRKWFHTNFMSEQNPGEAWAGMINWDLGRDLVPGDRPYMYRVSKMTVGNGPTTFQWKAERIGPTANLPNDDTLYPSAYIKSFSGGPTLNAKYSSTAGDLEYYYSEGLNKLGNVTMSGWQWLQNTPDEKDGGMIMHSSTIKDGGHYVRQRPSRSTGTVFADDLVTTQIPYRPRWLKVQDFMGNTNGLTTDIDLYTTDYLWQLNGSLFVLADNEQLESAQLWTPLIPTAVDGNEWELRLWKGMMADYTNKYLFLLDSDLNVVEGVKL